MAFTAAAITPVRSDAAQSILSRPALGSHKNREAQIAVARKQALFGCSAKFEFSQLAASFSVAAPAEITRARLSDDEERPHRSSWQARVGLAILPVLAGVVSSITPAHAAGRRGASEAAVASSADARDAAMAFQAAPVKDKKDEKEVKETQNQAQQQQQQQAPAEEEGPKKVTKGEIWRQKKLEQLKKNAPTIVAVLGTSLVVGGLIVTVKKRVEQKRLNQTQQFLQSQMASRRSFGLDTPTTPASTVPAAPAPAAPAPAAPAAAAPAAAPKEEKKPFWNAANPGNMVNNILEGFKSAKGGSGGGDDGMNFGKIMELLKMLQSGGNPADLSEDKLKEIFGLQDEDMAGVADAMKRLQSAFDGNLDEGEREEMNRDLARTWVFMKYPQIYDIPSEEIKSFKNVADTLGVNMEDIMSWSNFDEPTRRAVLKEVVLDCLDESRSAVNPEKASELEKLREEMGLPAGITADLVSEIASEPAPAADAPSA